jgi:hypothetical protein
MAFTRSTTPSVPGVFGSAWKALTDVQRTLVEGDIRALAAEINAASSVAAAVELRRRIGGLGNLESYARCLEAGARRAG